jgi:hypothetical protein
MRSEGLDAPPRVEYAERAIPSARKLARTIDNFLEYPPWVERRRDPAPELAKQDEPPSQAIVLRAKIAQLAFPATVDLLVYWAGHCSSNAAAHGAGRNSLLWLISTTRRSGNLCNRVSLPVYSADPSTIVDPEKGHWIE